MQVFFLIRIGGFQTGLSCNKSLLSEFESVRSRGAIKSFRLTVLSFFLSCCICFMLCELGLTLERDESRILVHYLKK